ncbi:MAG: N-acetylmuramoyl-L-alanine amidase family protein [Clostridia bacterium]|nr:N-acetylmuramoyl-L-alanine amidase family protein [Clostridia bacterium]
MGFIKKFLASAACIAVIAAMSVETYASTVNMTLIYDGQSHNYSAQSIDIEIDGEKITDMDVPPIILNDRTLVPARAVFEKMGAEIVWNEKTQEVYIMHKNDLLVIKIDSSEGIKNGTAFTMDMPAKIINDRTLIPLRAVSEALGCQVSWNSDSRLISISTSGKSNDDTNNSDSNGNNTSDDTNNNTNNNNQNSDNNTGSSDNTSQNSIFDVTGVDVPSSIDDEQIFTIHADSEIGTYNSFILSNNRLVVDINNAKMNVKNTDIKDTNSSVVSAVRFGQLTSAPYVTRAVFDLKSIPKYEVNLSSDKKSITVKFDTTILKVSDLSTSSSGGTDTIKVYGNGKLSASYYTLSNPPRAVIEISNAVSSLDSTYSVTKCDFITGIRTSQYDATTVQIVAELNKNVNVELDNKDDYLAVNITKSSLENLSYDTSSHTITIENASKIDTSDITINDNYLSGSYVINFNDDYQDILGKGNITCSDNYINTINVSENSDGDSVITANENAIVASKIINSGDKVTIQFVNPKEVYDKIVVLDPGHGKADNGASGNGLREKNVTLAIVQRVYALFEKDPNIKAYATRLDDSYPTNASRAAMANQIADLFVSVHANSSINTAPNGSEVLYTEHANETGGGDKLTSKIAAQIALTWVINSLQTTNRGIKDRPDLIVLNQTKVPAILIETAFISNPDDAAKLGSDEYLDKVAHGIYTAISAMMSQYNVR